MASSIYFHRRYQEEGGRRFFWLCIGSMLLSASIHRTGLLVQASVLAILIVNRLLERSRRGNSRRELLVIAGAAAVLLPVFIGRVLPLIISTPLIEEHGLLQKIRFTLWTMPTRFTLVFSLLCLVGLVSRLRHGGLRRNGALPHHPSVSRLRLDLVYLGVGLFFYLIPLRDLELSTRFFAFFHGIIYYCFAYPFNLFAHPSIHGKWHYKGIAAVLVGGALWHSAGNILDASQSIMTFFRDGLGKV